VKLEVAPRQPALQFGGSTWLSNDDSMSLASAQRMLWALQNGAYLSPGDIRKHELLNYFTFDAPPPSDDELFSVAADASVDGEQLHVALAVRGQSPQRPPLDLTVVVDTSCSMKRDDRMAFTRRALNLLGEQLRPGDTVDLVSFDDRATVALDDLALHDEPAVWSHAVASLVPRGGTNLEQALQTAYATALSTPSSRHRARHVMLFTDAQTNQGQLDPAVLGDIGRHFDEHGVGLTAVGVGHDVNDDALDELSERGKGAYVFLGSDAVVDRFFGERFDAMVHTIAHDVRFRLHLPPSLALERFHGEEASTDARDVQPVHFYSGNRQLFLSELRIGEDGLQPSDDLQLEIRWRDPVTGASRTQHHYVTVGDALDSSGNVDKARALVALSEVLMAQAMHRPVHEACSTFTQRSADLDDPELRYVESLLARRCR
jgi:Ca-activated chloride channel family protein